MGRLTPLHENLIASYTLDELAVLCGALDIPFEHLRGETLPARAWSLLQYAARHDKLPALVAQCARDFPNRDWSLPPPRQPDEPDDDEWPNGGVQVRIGDVSGAVNIGGIAEVRNNTGQVAVGSKNVIQIGSLNVPRWLAIALPLLLLAVLVVAGIGTAGIMSVTAPTPTPVIGPDRMSGAFNIAVAQIPETDLDGRQTRTADGDRVGEWVFDSLRSALKDTTAAQIWHDSLPLAEKGAFIGIITGTTPAERQESARALAERIGAHLVIYGNLKKSGNQAELEPEFYVATAAASLKRESEAEDIVGSNRLGAPVGIPLPLKGDIGLGVSASLESRAIFVRGLLFDLIGLHDKALEDFRRIRSAWSSDDERAVLSFFLGREALFLLRNADRATAIFGTTQNALEDARTNFEAATTLNPNLPLGFWGLGTALLKRAEPVITSDNVDVAGPEFAAAEDDLARAIEAYTAALTKINIEQQPTLAGKIRTSLANAHRLSGFADLIRVDEDPAAAGKADAHFAEAMTLVNSAFPLIDARDARSLANAFFVRGVTQFNMGVSRKLLAGDVAGGNALLEKAKADFDACLQQFDDPQSKLVLDQTLRDYRDTNCAPALADVTEALKE
jgi:tetratricopeptide (TPR) repeat protein